MLCLIPQNNSYPKFYWKFPKTLSVNLDTNHYTLTNRSHRRCIRWEALTSGLIEVTLRNQHSQIGGVCKAYVVFPANRISSAWRYLQRKSIFQRKQGVPDRAFMLGYALLFLFLSHFSAVTDSDGQDLSLNLFFVRRWFSRLASQPFLGAKNQALRPRTINKASAAFAAQTLSRSAGITTSWALFPLEQNLYKFMEENYGKINHSLY